MSKFRYTNAGDQEAPEELPNEFTVSASSNTDIWLKPPSTDSFNAPILYRTCPLKSFRKARVAIQANWQKQYDQGGLVLVVKKSDGSRQWIKTGIEWYDETANISTVAADRWADWSLLPLPSGGQAATVEMERAADDSLWIYLIEGVKRTPIREVTWVFENEDAECWIGAYAARPAEGEGNLAVKFVHLVVETA